MIYTLCCAQLDSFQFFKVVFKGLKVSQLQKMVKFFFFQHQEFCQEPISSERNSSLKPLEFYKVWIVT